MAPKTGWVNHAQYQKSSEKTDDRKIVFSHPLVSDTLGNLVLTVNPYNVIWQYGLNTANFPTYGGEVVQILSMYFDDMTISGEVRSYGDIERIYGWFLNYMQVATQGTEGTGSYDARPVQFDFPDRGWTFHILPTSLPSFKYSRDIAAPTYEITAAVLEPEPALESAIIDDATFKANAGDDFDTFGKASAGIGFREDNPFSGPTSQLYKRPDALKENIQSLGEFFTSLVPAYLSSDFKTLESSSSPPSDIETYLKNLKSPQQTGGRPIKP